MLAAVAGGLLLGGCATTDPGDGDLGKSVAERTGHQLAVEDENAELIAPGVTFLDGLTEEEAIAMALWSQPRLKATLAELGIGRAAIIQAGQLTNPNFSVLFPAGPKQLEFTLNFPVEAIWLRPQRVTRAETDYHRLAESLLQAGLDARRDVRVAFAEIWRSQELRDLRREQARVRAAIAGLQAKRMEIGALSERDATRAKLNAAQAVQAATRARHDAITADLQLRALVGLEFWKESLQWAHEISPTKRLPNEDAVIAGALASRPDLRAAELAIEVNGRALGLAKQEVYSAMAVIDANGIGDNFEIGPGLNFVTLPIFHRNDGQVAGAKAVLRRSMLEYAARRSEIAAEVQQALRDVAREGDEWGDARERIIPAAEQLLEQTRAAEAAGGITAMEVLQAELQLLDTRVASLEPAARHHAALARLERAVGLRLSDFDKIANLKLP